MPKNQMRLYRQEKLKSSERLLKDDQILSDDQVILEHSGGCSEKYIKIKKRSHVKKTLSRQNDILENWKKTYGKCITREANYEKKVKFPN